MPILFNTLLREAGLHPADVRLLRHKDNRAMKGRSPYELWRDDRPRFDLYQAVQGIMHRKKLNAPYWAVFLADFSDRTMFVGVYKVKYTGLLGKYTPKPHMDGVDKAGSCDFYDLTLLQDRLGDLIGRLFIHWGPGARAWIQHPARHEKPVAELRTGFQEPPFPGLLNLTEPLSKLQKMPTTWVTVLKSCRGVYLLTCPRTKEQYVGSATGEEGLWGRWQDYLQTGHGGNVGLKSRDPSDYQVSMLEVAGSSATTDDILAMEGRWQSKLQSREMGLNRNHAGMAQNEKRSSRMGSA